MFLKRRIVHQNIELPERVDRFRYGIPAIGRISNIARQQDAAAALVLNCTFCFFRILIFIQIRNRNVCAFTRKKHRHGSSDA